MKKGIIGFLAAAVLLSGCVQTAVPTQPPVVTVPPTVPETAPHLESIPTEPVIVMTQPVTEPPTQAVEPTPETFVRVADYLPHVRVELAYATEQNFTGKVIYDFEDAYLRYGTVCKLMEADAILAAQGYGIVIWDAYRPVYAQERLWEICPDPAYVSKPGTGTQSHCRGLAVDVTLYDLETGELLPMPTSFDSFTALADRDYTDCTPSTAANARLLEDTLKNCGFKPYSAEWWHFSDTDSYEIEDAFDPAEPNL